MRRQDAIKVAELLDEVQRGRFAPQLFSEGVLTNVGIVWMEMLEHEDDAALATKAVVSLYTATPPDGRSQKPITPADFREVMRALKRAAMPRPIPEGESARTYPQWTKGWLIARSRQDFRTWPAQKPGYDSMQKEYASTKTYVWPDQIPMPEEDRLKYEAEGGKLTAREFDKLFLAVVSGR